MMINNTLNTLKDGFNKRYNPGDANHEALKRLMEPISDAAGALEIMAANPDPEQSLEAHDLKLGRAGKKLKEALELAQDKLDRLKANAGLAFDSGLKEHSGLKYGPFATEIRGMIRPLGPAERVRFIQDRILAGDGESLAAVLLPPAFISGLTEEEKDRFSEQFFKVVVPKIWDAKELYFDLGDFVQAVFKTAGRAIKTLGQPSKYGKIEEQLTQSLNAEDRLKRTVGGSFLEAA